MGRLRRLGILGMNERNLRYVVGCNPRARYPMVDDKLQTKRLCAEAGLPTPRLLGALRHPGEVRTLREIASEEDSFVLKPARGAMGNGVLVVRGRDGGRFVRADDKRVRFEDLRFHALETLAGLYSLGGQPDRVVVEECLVSHPDLKRIAPTGVPDLRVLVYRGIPVMAMLRLPTERSRGRANLHQGAVGAGIDLGTGDIVATTSRRGPVEEHPDTGKRVLDVRVPHFRQAVDAAVRATQPTGLGYLGVDVVLDAERGPLLLELNARPGLSIQLANAAGLRPLLAAVDRWVEEGLPVDERIALGVRIAREAGKR